MLMKCTDWWISAIWWKENWKNTVSSQKADFDQKFRRILSLDLTIKQVLFYNEETKHIILSALL